MGARQPLSYRGHLLIPTSPSFSMLGTRKHHLCAPHRAEGARQHPAVQSTARCDAQPKQDGRVQ
eukprot:scaffold301258_cov23-Tisochrysis_lutea.AAC.1